MWTVLIAHHDAAFAEQLAAELRTAGYRIIDCSGPWPPAERCIRCDKGYCPLTESADLMIYDPRMTAVDTSGRRHNLADREHVQPLQSRGPFFSQPNAMLFKARSSKTLPGLCCCSVPWPPSP